MKSLKAELENVQITADLIQGALHHLEFLAEINSNKENLIKEENLVKAIYRYEKFWLPFYANENTTTTLTPPLDIEFVWHSHMLNPTNYYAYCMKTFGKLLTHQNLSKTQRDSQRALTLTKWNEAGIIKIIIDEAEFLNFKTQIDYDLIAACKRQSSFFYQVCLPHYKSLHYLKLAFKSYRKFLYVAKLNPQAFLVPTYAIDLMWHTHHRVPQAYVNDTLKSLGRVMTHDDSVNDRTPGSKLNTSYEVTCSLWAKHYNEDYFFPGGMFRGANGPVTFPHTNDYSFVSLSTQFQTKVELVYAMNLINLNENELTLELKMENSLYRAKVYYFPAIQSWSNIFLFNESDVLASHSRLINLNELPSKELTPDLVVGGIETNLNIKHERAMMLTDKKWGEFALVKAKFKSNKFTIKYVSLMDGLVKVAVQLEKSKSQLTFVIESLRVSIDFKEGFVKFYQNDGKSLVNDSITIENMFAFLLSIICLYLPTLDKSSNELDFVAFKLFDLENLSKSTN
jgi:hypothetical protein